MSKYNKIIDTNKDVIMLKGDHVIPLFEEVSATLLNREGMVSIGGKVHCFATGKTIIASTVDDVQKAYKVGRSPKESTIILEDRVKSNARQASVGPCSVINQTAYNSENNRRVDVAVSINRRYFVTGSDQYGNFVTVEYYTYVRGDPFKKNVWGNWTYYSTGNTLYSQYNTYLKVYFPPDGQSFYAVNTPINDTRSNDGTFIDYSQTLATYYDVRENAVTSYPPIGYYFDKSLSPAYPNSPVGKYTSGGVPNGVQITCP